MLSAARYSHLIASDLEWAVFVTNAFAKHSSRNLKTYTLLTFNHQLNSAIDHRNFLTFRFD